MSGLNGISISILIAIINAVNLKSKDQPQNNNAKPPAPWRTPEEFAELRKAGKCTRCAKKEHFFKKCPSYTWAKRPQAVSAALGSPKVYDQSSSAIEDDEYSENE